MRSHSMPLTTVRTVPSFVVACLLLLEKEHVCSRQHLLIHTPCATLSSASIWIVLQAELPGAFAAASSSLQLLLVWLGGPRIEMSSLAFVCAAFKSLCDKS